MKKYIIYEIKNNLGNFMGVFFGFILPIFMTILFYYVFKGQVAGDVAGFGTQMVLQNLMMIPMALVLIGFSATFSSEIEQGVTLRLVLLHYNHKKQILAKFIGQFLTVLFSIILFCTVCLCIIPMKTPNIQILISYIICFFLLIVLFYLLAYSIASLTRKFSSAFGITMGLYFAVMILSGMMGVETNQFPGAMRFFSNLLPTSQMTQIFPKVWDSHMNNAAPLIQSFLFIGGICGVLLLWTYKKNRRHS